MITVGIYPARRYRVALNQVLAISSLILPFSNMIGDKMVESKTEISHLADCDRIPIIDLSTLNSPHLYERQKLAQSIYDACTQVGFFYIKVCA